MSDKSDESGETGSKSGSKSVTALEPNSSERPAWRRRLVRGSQVLAGLLVALILTECAFRWRDGAAFPHVNIYVADAELGVRLEPNASEKIQFGGNPITTIRTNSDGYRGDDFKPVENAILVVGDSQVFGLGVEENETFASRLAELTGRPVLNGGVPTYGPAEYTAVARELLSKYKITTVVYTVNFVNDLFEADRPNRERHKVWDGWAVRSETAPGDATWFPFRGWLMSKSHAVFALRRWLYERGPKSGDDGFNSEGTWEDVARVGSTATEEKNHRVAMAIQDDNERQARLAQISEALKKKRKEIAAKMQKAFPDGSEELLRDSGSNPGDIVARVQNPRAEAARRPEVTAAHIRYGVAYRNELAAKLNPRKAQHKEASEALAAERALHGERAALRNQPRLAVHVPSALEPQLRAIKAVTDEFGAELVVVALPIDVQVTHDEWKKYGVVAPPDMTATRVLLSDLVTSAEILGARAIDVTTALANTNSAFLDRDIHMTAAGHAAVAGAIAERMKGPAALPLPKPGLPAGRSRIPSQEEWRFAPTLDVSSYPCSAAVIREWLRLHCRQNKDDPNKFEVLKGGHGEQLIASTESSLSLLMPVLAGDAFEVVWVGRSDRHRFNGSRPLEEGSIELTRAAERRADAMPRVMPTGERPLVGAVNPDDQHLCNCQQEVDPEFGLHGPECMNMVGAATQACMAAYEDDCESLVLCSRGDPLALPPCPAGFANAGGSGQCFQLCSSRVACEEGTCTSWHGASICLEK